MFGLFWEKQKRRYEIVATNGDIISCYKCKKVIELGLWCKVQRLLDKHIKETRFFCEKCPIDQQRHVAFSSISTALVVNEIPDNGVIQHDGSVVLRECKNTDVFLAAHSNKGISAEADDVLILDSRRQTEQALEQIETSQEKMKRIDNLKEEGGAELIIKAKPFIKPIGKYIQPERHKNEEPNRLENDRKKDSNV